MSKSPFTALIIDDVLSNRETLQLLIRKYCPGIDYIIIAESIQEARILLSQHSVQLVFLDIQMPKEDGFSLLDGDQDYNFDIIFVTAYDQYAIKALRYGAIDYLIKPVNIQELSEAVTRVLQRQQLPSSEQLKRNMTIVKNTDPNEIAILSKSSIDIIRINQLIRCEADGRCTICFIQGGRRIVSSKNLKEFELMLEDKGFARVHHSHLINMNHIDGFQRKRNGVIKLSNGDEIVIAQRRKTEFMQQMNQKISL
ncbi:Transcriptional regulatory protein YehT [compost metagenome]